MSRVIQGSSKPSLADSADILAEHGFPHYRLTSLEIEHHCCWDVFSGANFTGSSERCVKWPFKAVFHLCHATQPLHRFYLMGAESAVDLRSAFRAAASVRRGTDCYEDPPDCDDED